MEGGKAPWKWLVVASWVQDSSGVPYPDLAAVQGSGVRNFTWSERLPACLIYFEQILPFPLNPNDWFGFLPLGCQSEDCRTKRDHPLLQYLLSSLLQLGRPLFCSVHVPHCFSHLCLHFILVTSTAVILQVTLSERCRQGSHYKVRAELGHETGSQFEVCALKHRDTQWLYIQDWASVKGPSLDPGSEQQ